MSTYASHMQAKSGQSVPPSSVAPPSDMEQMLQRLLQSAMAPIQAAVADVTSRITEIERDREWYAGQDDDPFCLNDDHLLPHQEPPTDRFSRPWGRTEDKFPGFSRLTATPADDGDSHMDDADQHLEDEDAILNSALPSEQRQNSNKAYEVHPFFRETAATVFSQSGISPEGWQSLSANDFEYDCSEMWHDFAHQIGTSLGPLPPLSHIATPFVIYCRNRLGEKLLLRQVGVSLLGSKKVKDNTRPPHVNDSDTPPKACAPPPAPRVDVPLHPDPSHPAPTPGPAFDGWRIVGKKGKQSWAAMAAAAPKPHAAPKPLPPTRDHATSGFVTRPQLESLTKQTIVSLFNTRFPTGPRIPCNASKEAAVTTFLLRMQEPSPSTPTHAPPPPKVISKSEFTLSQDPSSPGPSGTCSDAVLLVRQVQGLIRSSGANVKAELIGGRWSSQSSRNFVLVFNGNPTFELVLSLQHIFARVFGSAYSLTPARGYTRVILNSVPTMRDSPSSPLPTAQELHDELDRNDVCHGLLIFGDPYWLTARAEGSCHGSISFAFLDKDGSRLQRMIRNPPYMFGNRTSKVRKYVSRPLLSECTRCLRLGHTEQRCHSPPSVIVCPICGNGHKEEEHAAKCPNVAKHVGVACTCPPSVSTVSMPRSRWLKAIERHRLPAPSLLPFALSHLMHAPLAETPLHT